MLIFNKYFIFSILLCAISLHFDCTFLNSFDEHTDQIGLFTIPVHLSANNYKLPLRYYVSLDEGYYVGDDMADSLDNHAVNFIYDPLPEDKMYHLKVIIWDKLKVRFDSTLTFLNSEGILANDTTKFVSDTVIIN
jgi:hypothetical protein